MLLSLRHSKKGPLAAARWPGVSAFGGGWGQEPPTLGGHSAAQHPAQGHRSAQHPPGHHLRARLARAPPFQRETPTGMQTVQAGLISHLD